MTEHKRWLILSMVNLLVIAALWGVSQVLAHDNLQAGSVAQSGENSSSGLSQAKVVPQAAVPQSLLPYDTYFASQGLVFLPVSSGMAYHGGVAGCRSSDVPGDYFSPVNIPHGSQLDFIEVDYYNPNSTVQTGYAGVEMGTDQGVWAGVVYLDFNPSVLATPGYHIESKAVNHVINNYNNTYSFVWHATGPEIQLCQVRLYYRPPIWTMTFLPTVKK